MAFLLSRNATRVARSVLAPRCFSASVGRGGAAGDAAAIGAAAFSHGRSENAAAAAWMRFPGMESRNASTFAFGERQEEKTGNGGSTGGAAFGVGANGNRSNVSYWGVEPAKATKEDGSECSAKALPFQTDMLFQRRTMIPGMMGAVPGMVGGMLPHSKSLHRSFHSNAPLKEAEKEQIQPQVNILRPLSPHLPIYKPQSSSTFSILNRISSAYLSVLVFSFYLLYMKVGMVGFTYPSFYEVLFYSSKLHLISLEIGALALVYHIYATIRHLY